MKIINVVGARPNLMKTAPLMEAYEAYADISAGQWPQSRTPELWDGKAAQRIVKTIAEKY